LEIRRRVPPEISTRRTQREKIVSLRDGKVRVRNVQAQKRCGSGGTGRVKRRIANEVLWSRRTPEVLRRLYVPRKEKPGLFLKSALREELKVGGEVLNNYLQGGQLVWGKKEKNEQIIEAYVSQICRCWGLMTRD